VLKSPPSLEHLPLLASNLLNTIQIRLAPVRISSSGLLGINYILTLVQPRKKVLRRHTFRRIIIRELRSKMANAPLMNRKGSILHNRLVAHFKMTGIAIYDDFDEKKPLRKEALEIDPGTVILASRNKTDSLRNDLQRLQYKAQMISAY
jgi:hypothetical protein